MIEVFLIDDASGLRQVLPTELPKAGDIKVVGAADDPYVARDKIVRLRPDVVVLDLEMPGMDGLTFLRKLMRYIPLPVVVISSPTVRGSHCAVQALALGAVDFVCRPGPACASGDMVAALIEKIRVAARARPARRELSERRADRIEADTRRLGQASQAIVAIGGSTGATKAIEHILTSLPAETPGTVIVQHMPERFTAAFAERLNEVSRLEVREARPGDRLACGLALLAPGNKHMVLRRGGSGYFVDVKDGPRVHHQRPSVDVLFHSVARHVAMNTVGVILTGMGADGASGLLAMRKAGARTFAQDQASSVVFGMPKEAVSLGAADEALPLDRIPSRILEAVAARSPAKVK